MISLPVKFRTETLLNIAGRNPVFFFDFDGTLTEIVERPHQVELKAITKFILEELVRRFNVGILSGRRLVDVKQLIGIKGLYYSGNHGVEIEGPDFRFIEPQSVGSYRYILSISKAISDKLAGTGALIEQKKYSVSIHYRNLNPKTVKKVLSELDAILGEPLRRGKIQILHGKKVIEVRPPVDWDKGKALRIILEKIDGTGKPVFFGDDITDEYGFREANRLKGISVFVGRKNRNTAAGYWIESPSALIGELSKFLFIVE
ncbi:MAG: trehalose-phosphatase [Candidatus Kryptoniota bacterium]